MAALRFGKVVGMAALIDTREERILSCFGGSLA